MLQIFVILFLAGLAIALVGTALARRLARRLRLMDEPGVRKVHKVATPRNGGIGIFWGIALPIVVGLVLLWTGVMNELPVLLRRFSPASAEVVTRHLGGLYLHAPLALLLLAGTAAIHFLGLLDDRKALPPWPKLLGQLAGAAGLVLGGELLAPGAFRLLTVLDGAMPTAHLGLAISAVLSILWITAVTNAFNFLDNMDGLSAGVAFIAASMFLIAAWLNGQWFVCGLLALFLGSTLGFLCFNFPPASIFMGDGGSMVLGFFLSALTLRTTYLPPDASPKNHWYALLAPLIILAVPLYDLAIVSALRVARGRSPMQGDTNHFSHRLVRAGFSKRAAVLIIYAVTFSLGLSAPLLTRAEGLAPLLIVLQVAGLLVVIGILERVGEHST